MKQASTVMRNSTLVNGASFPGEISQLTDRSDRSGPAIKVAASDAMKVLK